jgi:hypothetical protein
VCECPAKSRLSLHQRSALLELAASAVGGNWLDKSLCLGILAPGTTARGCVMPQRMRLIRHRAYTLFRQENPSHHIILDSTSPDDGGPGRLAVTEAVRKSYYERAEQELIIEGKISPFDDGKG